MRKKDPAKEAAILEAAVSAFAKQGFHATKMSMIANEAGVAAGSLYLYFKNKESIILHIISKVWTQMYDDYHAVYQRSDFTAVEKVDALIDLVFDIFMGNAERAIIFVNEQHHLAQNGIRELMVQEKKFIQLCEQVIREGVEDGLFNPHADIALFKDFVFGGIRHLLSLWAHQPEEYKLNLMREEIKQYIKKGILVR